MSEPVKLDLASARRVVAATKSKELDYRGEKGRRRQNSPPPFTLLIAKSGEDGVPAREGLKPGKAEVALYEFEDLNAEEPVLVKAKDADGEDAKIDCFNLARSEIEKDTMLMLEFGIGVWWVVTEICDGAEDDEGGEEN